MNDEVAKKAIAISASHNWWIGIRTDPVPALRHFYWLSGGPFTSLSFGHWGVGYLDIRLVCYATCLLLLALTLQMSYVGDIL